MALIADTVLEQRCRGVVDAIPLPTPFTVAALVQAVADQMGCVIILAPLTGDITPGVSALIESIDNGFVLHYCPDDDPWRALNCLCHELAHVLCAHMTIASCDGDDPEPAAHELFPHLLEAGAAQSWGGSLLLRCHLMGPMEHEAELIATLLLGRIEEQTSKGHGRRSPSGDAVLARYAKALGGSRSGRACHR